MNGPRENLDQDFCGHQTAAVGQRQNCEKMERDDVSDVSRRRVMQKRGKRRHQSKTPRGRMFFIT